MKQYHRLLRMVGMIIGIGLIVCYAVLASVSGNSFDIVQANDIVQSVEENWGEFERLEELKAGLEYEVIDTHDQVLFHTEDAPGYTLMEAVAHNLPHMRVEKKGELLGEVIFAFDEEEQLLRAQKTICVALLGMGALLIVAMGLYGGYIKRTIVKPFENMRMFANEIAVGNLDFALERDKNNMFGAFTESFDIMREELSAANKREEELKKREKELIAQLSHDLRTPITGIKLTSELLKVKLTGAYEREKIDQIYQKAEQMNVMVNDLFASTLNELGQMQVYCRDEEAAILKDIVKRQDDKNLVSAGRIPECLIHIDSRRMSQIVANILSNSYKYAGTAIEVKYQINGGYLQMDIRDFGPGVPMEELPLVTNKFYRGKAEKIILQEGSGLGLYISKSLMEEMKGELICMNEQPGFLVRLLIPLS